VMPCDRMVVLDGSETGLAQHHSFLLEESRVRELSVL